MAGVLLEVALLAALGSAEGLRQPTPARAGDRCQGTLFDPVSDAVLVYSEPKTGTSTLYHSVGMLLRPPCAPELANLHDPRKCNAVKSHNIPEAVEFLERLPNGSRAWVVSIARSPFDQAPSAFFQGIHQRHSVGTQLMSTPLSSLMREFHAQLLPSRSVWWSQHYSETFGLNITQYPFDHNKKILHIPHSWKGKDLCIVVVRHEDIGDWPRIMARFFPNMTLTFDNIGSRKTYNSTYRQFLNQLNYSDAEISVMTQSEAMHFYTPTEIGRFVKRARSFMGAAAQS